jgi:membrane-bound inhibitor of C-type lysozyme
MRFGLAELGRSLSLFFIAGSLASATDLIVHLPDSASVQRTTVQYQCDSSAAKVGVPTSPFPVEYINGGGNSLAIVPVNGNQLIFTVVMSGSGARYAAGPYIWWDAHGSVTLYMDALSGKAQSVCSRVPGK